MKPAMDIDVDSHHASNSTSGDTLVRLLVTTLRSLQVRWISTPALPVTTRVTTLAISPAARLKNIALSIESLSSLRHVEVAIVDSIQVSRQMLFLPTSLRQMAWVS
jgi:hypothetical protein